MLSSLQILLPVFGLVLAGFVCRRRGLLGPTAASELNRFVVWLALPALLFDIMAHASWQQLYQPGFVATFALACGAIFVLILIVRLLNGRHLADASVDAIAASYPNTGDVGFPLCMIVFGTASLTPTTIATILVTCVLFAAAIVLIELGLQTERKPHKIALGVVRRLAGNPLIVSPILGTLVSVTHISLPQSAETFLKLLGGAASPCALVSLGLFLAERRSVNTGYQASLLLTGSKLLLQPLLTWWLAARVFGVAAAACSNGGGAGCTPDRHRSVHARRVLLSRSPCYLAHHPSLYIGFGELRRTPIL